MEHHTRSARRRRARTAASSAVLLAATTLLAVSCGDDDGDSNTASVCESRDELRTSVTALGDVDILSDGTNGLEAAADDVRSALDGLGQSAEDEFGDEVDAVQAALGDLGDALRSFGDQPRSEAVSAVSDAATQLRDTATTLGDELQNACD